MEVKVWVEGLQRVVCGASWDTTCQDVVIALAHAMGRTGRFTLIEKWRDNERPLTPAECPLQVLHKWGEYAPEVRFMLCQADSERHKAVSREQLAVKGMEKSASMHRILSPQSQSLLESSVKRSLTFSGAHSQLLEDRAWLNASMPTSKFRKTQQGPVPNGDLRPQPGPLYPLHSSTQVKQVKAVGAGGHPQGRAPPPLSPLSPSTSSSSSDHPHHRLPSPAGPQQGRGDLHSTAADPASFSLSSPLNHHHLGDANRPSAFQPPKTLRARGPVSPSKCSTSGPEGPSQPQSSPQHLQPQPASLSQSSADPHHPPSPPPTSSAVHPQKGPHPHSHHELLQHDTDPPSSDPVPLSPAARSSPSPASPSHSGTSTQPPSILHHRSEDTPPSPPDPTTPQQGPQIEEYDLDHNFPGGSHKDWNHNEAPSHSLEYRLEEALGSGSGSGGQLEGEHAKLLRLVNMQQQRLKTQESQISLVNTEISNLEEKEMEYEENLHVIMEELLLQENRQRDLEPQLQELEKTDWEAAAQEEQTCQVDLTLQVASCRASLLEKAEEVQEVTAQETQLLQELEEEEATIARERERLKEEEAQAREEGERTQGEITQLQAQFTELQQQSAECESSLSRVEGELSCLDRDLQGKTEVLGELETQLKEENLKDFGTSTQPPVPQMDANAKDSQKVLRRILEDSLSPRYTGGCHNEGGDRPLGPALLAAFAASTQSGVWV